MKRVTFSVLLAATVLLLGACWRNTGICTPTIACVEVLDAAGEVVTEGVSFSATLDGAALTDVSYAGGAVAPADAATFVAEGVFEKGTYYYDVMSDHISDLVTYETCDYADLLSRIEITVAVEGYEQVSFVPSGNAICYKTVHLTQK